MLCITVNNLFLKRIQSDHMHSFTSGWSFKFQIGLIEKHGHHPFVPTRIKNYFILPWGEIYIQHLQQIHIEHLKNMDLPSIVYDKLYCTRRRALTSKLPKQLFFYNKFINCHNFTVIKPAHSIAMENSQSKKQLYSFLLLNLDTLFLLKVHNQRRQLHNFTVIKFGHTASIKNSQAKDHNSNQSI